MLKAHERTYLVWAGQAAEQGAAALRTAGFTVRRLHPGGDAIYRLGMRR